MTRRTVPILAAVAVLAIGPLYIAARHAHAAAAPIRKQTIRLAMRDGVHLATDLYLPAAPGHYPTLVIRTPYNKEGMVALGEASAQQGYAAVIQDTRGRFASEGEKLPWIGDGWTGHTDGVETLAWVAHQPWCDGKIGTLGGSALGINQLLTAGSGTPYITCQHISVATPDLYLGLVYPGGVLKKALVEGWLQSTQHSPQALKIWVSHPDYDSYWENYDLTTRWNKVNYPAVHIGGWFDLFTQGTIDSFTGYQEHGGPKARGAQKLVMGPWTHGFGSDRAGELTFPNGGKPPTHYNDAGTWFNHYLKGMDNGVDREPAVTYYVMGDVTNPHAPGNVWRTASSWPPPSRLTRFYLHGDRSLSPAPPETDRPLGYTYNPANPVPTLGGPQLNLPAGPMDQKRVEARPDVLVFTSPVLQKPVEVTGRVRATLSVSSDAPDTDFTAKLCDVYPDGRSFNMCEGILRARFRNSFRREELMKPGHVYEIPIDLTSTSVIFNKGHRIRLDVTSSSSPGYDPNPNTGEKFRSSNRTRIAHNQIHLDHLHPSYVLLPVVP